MSGINEQGNVWSAAATGAATNGNIVDCEACPFLTAIGHASGATTISLMLSADGTNFYAGPTVVLSAAGDFYINQTGGCQYATLQSSNNATATGTICGRK